MTKTVQLLGETVNLSALGTLSSPGLAKLYNAAVAIVGGSAVNRFSDAKAAYRRTFAVLEVLHETVAKAPVVEAPVVKAPVARRGMVFAFPFVEAKPAPREGTRRRVLYDMLTTPTGATFDELHAASWATQENLAPERQVRATYEGLRLLHFYCGYGMRQDAAGRIRLITSAK
jgi:hypothetical protein